MSDAAPDPAAAALLALLEAEDGQSSARLCKRLGCSRSELQRLLARLGADPAVGGLDLVECRRDDGRDTLWLTSRARALRQLPAPLAAQAAQRLSADGAAVEEQAWLAEETPVALLFNGEPYAVMLATPADLEDFAYGFALGEGIVEAAAELRLLEVLPGAQGVTLQLGIPAARAARLGERRRQLAGRSGCGLCGAESIAAAIAALPRLAPAPPLPAARLLQAFERLEARQPWNARCGALHAAAALQGEALLVREDVGRHNALDKVVGALARAGQAADALLVTSRASYELVQKAARAGIATLAAVSAPTAFAQRQAQAAGVALYGYARGTRITRYA
jgi:FdhD protein